MGDAVKQSVREAVSMNEKRISCGEQTEMLGVFYLVSLRGSRMAKHNSTFPHIIFIIFHFVGFFAFCQTFTIKNKMFEKKIKKVSL